MIEYETLLEIEKIFKNMPDPELCKKLKVLELTKDREEVLKDVLTGKKVLHISEALDINIYALKFLFPNSYQLLNLKETIFSKFGPFKYDPAKNGQNMIKHGISFGEVASYSTKFGTLIVPCPDTRDNQRVVIFSDLSLDNKENHFSLPLEGLEARSMYYTLTVAEQGSSGFRFISSRIISRTKFSKTMKNAFRHIYPDNPEKKQEFINRCIEILRRDLFEKVTPNTEINI